jgi:putative membrane protein
MAHRLEITAEGQARVLAAVRAAEGRTSGEIVTIITHQSDDYADVALWWSAGVALLALIALVLLPDFYMGLVDRLLGRWAFDWTPRAVLELALTVASLKFAAMWLLLLWRPLRLWLTPRPILAGRVRRRAVTYFRVGAERRTTGRTGVLLYVSLAEHRAEIVADESIHAKVAQSAWGDAMAGMIVHVRAGRIAEGMAAAVADMGDILAAHFPRASDDKNELPDRLITL